MLGFSKEYFMEYITNQGIILMVLINDAFILISVVVILCIGKFWTGKQQDSSERIIRLTSILSVAVTIVFGVIAETIIVSLVLITVGIL